jgi:hypothetical protein
MHLNRADAQGTLMKLKIDEAGHVVVSDGKPVYVDDAGKEVAFDYPATLATISRLNGEAKSHRERAEAAEGKLKAFEGIDDADAARRALATVKNLDDKKLVDAGEVEKVKAEAIKAVRAELEPIVKERDDLKGELHGEKIGGAFARSKFIADKVAVPADIVQARFGTNFKLEDGKVVAYDGAGNKLYSRAKPGEAAEFEEALELLIDAYPYKDQILKGTGGGSGARPGNGGGAGAKTMARSEFEKLDPAAKAKAMTVDKITLTD